MARYSDLIDLAKARYIKVVEVTGLSEKNGLRFQNAGKEYIAINSDLPLPEKTRALGFLLENYRGQAQFGSIPLNSIRCPTI